MKGSPSRTNNLKNDQFTKYAIVSVIKKGTESESITAFGKSMDDLTASVQLETSLKEYLASLQESEKKVKNREFSSRKQN